MPVHRGEDAIPNMDTSAAIFMHIELFLVKQFLLTRRRLRLLQAGGEVEHSRHNTTMQQDLNPNTHVRPLNFSCYVQ